MMSDLSDWHVGTSVALSEQDSPPTTADLTDHPNFESAVIQPACCMRKFRLHTAGCPAGVPTESGR